jgi:hypothetical protein
MVRVAYCRISPHPQAYINQCGVLLVDGFQISCEQNGQATGRGCGGIHWKGES